MNRLHGTDFPPISTREFDSTLNTFKHKAPGPSGITTLQLKNLPQNMKQYLLYIFNNDISAGYFPDSLKHAHMIFIPKAGSQHSVKNYRPISLLEIHGKLLGKILNNRLIHHLNTNNVMNSRQHGFRTSRGTHTALATLYETISQDIYNKHKIDIVLRDVSKAFDKVWHTGLQYKITNLNIHTCFTRILCDFLEDRTASVRLGRHSGTPTPLHTGVSQGSCLSPTLYSYNTHDIPEPIPNTDYICYAGDITQIISGRFTYKYTAQQTQHAILQLNNYEAKWKIQTHSDKFKIIPIRRHRTETIEIEGEELDKYETQGTVLGLDKSTHGVTQQMKKLKAMALGQLDKLYRFKGLSSHIKLKRYNAIVRATLLYPVIPLHAQSRSQLLQLQRVQNKALRLAYNINLADRISSQSIHEQYNIEPVNIALHRLATKTWEHMRDRLPDTYNKFTATHTSISFPSSLKRTLDPPPDSIYS